MRGLMDDEEDTPPEDQAPPGQPPGQPAAQPPAAAPGKPAAAPPAAAGPTAAPAGKPVASPEDQAAYDQFVKNGMRLMYDKKALPSIMKSLDGAGDPVQGMANTIAMLVARIVGSAKQSGKELSPNVILHGAGELLEQLADFSEQSGGHKYTDDELQMVAQNMVKATMGQGAPAQPDQAEEQQEPPGQPEEPDQQPTGLMG